MYKMICSMVVFGALIPLVGCGQSADDLVQQQIDHLNALADAIEAEADQEKIDEINQQMKETKEAMDALGLSEDELKKAAEKHEDELQEATKRLAEVQMSKMGDAMKDAMKQMGGKMPTMPDGFGDMPKLP